MSVRNFPILLVDDEEQILLSYCVILRKAGIDQVITVHDSRKVMPVLAESDIALIVLDLIMPHISGIELLDTIRLEYPHIPVVVMTASNELELAVKSMKSGAFDYIVKPVETSRFTATVQKALEMSELRDEVSNLKTQILDDRLESEKAFSSIITRDKKMLSIFRYAEAIAQTGRPVCICGETGTRKELFAKAVYALSGLTGKLVAVNVAGLDDTMFSDTLFGHKKGAYTGAEANREGLIVQASGGVIQLDEIGDLNELSQLKLLRLIEERAYYPLGSDTAETSSVRIIATTNRNLNRQIESGGFRRDLYYRLCAHSILIPPLRQRNGDIPLLLDYFLEEAACSLKKKEPSYPGELITLLSNYAFPGNVRELQAMVYDAVDRHRGGMLSMKSFRESINKKGNKGTLGSIEEREMSTPVHDWPGNFPTLKESEDFWIKQALKQAEGNQGIAASMLGISRQALNKRLKRKDTKH
jgi:DNA-binding NtrC family response regulator